jgi:hypothetical protein
MRRVFNAFVRGMASVAVIVALSVSAAAAPREDRDRGREPGLIKIIKKVVKTLGDGLTVPLP